MDALRRWAIVAAAIATILWLMHSFAPQRFQYVSLVGLDATVAMLWLPLSLLAAVALFAVTVHGNDAMRIPLLAVVATFLLAVPAEAFDGTWALVRMASFATAVVALLAFAEGCWPRPSSMP